MSYQLQETEIIFPSEMRLNVRGQDSRQYEKCRIYVKKLISAKNVELIINNKDSLHAVISIDSTHAHLEVPLSADNTLGSLLPEEVFKGLLLVLLATDAEMVSIEISSFFKSGLAARSVHRRGPLGVTAEFLLRTHTALKSWLG